MRSCRADVPTEWSGLVPIVKLLPDEAPGEEGEGVIVRQPWGGRAVWWFIFASDARKLDKDSAP